MPRPSPSRHEHDERVAARSPQGLRERARHDIDEAIEHYRSEAGPAAALNFIDALEDTFRQIGERPAGGSPCHAHELEIPGLRFRSVGRSPNLVFYVEREAEIDAWRVLRGARDNPAWMQQSREE
ncbi:MAG: type II toxin-antitoxin system RelE/ParE family toxin [Rhodospirillales bacterium]|nr:type II toxin-antitoxin system RelE/ParE family toxin [Rhodospirillales bacterium]